jgi:CSLREA domain-containing protein
VGAIGLVLLVALDGTTSAGAETFTVTTTVDHAPDGCMPADCTLREAVIAANQAPGADTILLRRGTYQLSIEGRNENNAETGDLDLLDNVSIRGLGIGVVIDARGIDRVFDVQPGSNSTVTFVTIRGGLAMVNEEDPREQDGSGGGVVVRTDARLNLNGVTVTGNEVLDVTGQDFGDGGGLSNFGTTTITNSTINRNVAENEGGGVETDEGTLVITNSVISNNQSGSDGGGIQVDDSGTLTLKNVIVGGNVAGANGGGIQVENSFVDIRNGLVVGNEAAGDGGGISLVQQAEATLRNVAITRNRADGQGGGLSVEEGSTATATATIVVANEPDNCVPSGVVAGCVP